MKAIISSVIAIFVFTSCNTMVGIGQDTRLLGEGVEKLARKAAPGGGGQDYSGAPVY
jgi:predicted small secreted protein